MRDEFLEYFIRLACAAHELRALGIVIIHYQIVNGHWYIFLLIRPLTMVVAPHPQMVKTRDKGT